jgi:Holliday junction DNA helicase RuvA
VIEVEAPVATVSKPTPPSSGAAQADALSALSNLGYSPSEAARAVAEVAGNDPGAEAPTLIRAALRLLAPKE